MAKPMAIHTVESIYEKTEEYGDCRIWKGYFGNGTPMIYHAGKMTSVRMLLLDLSGKYANRGNYFGTSCNDPGCVNIEHIAQRPPAYHYQRMTKNSALVSSDPIRCAKIAAAKRKSGKLTLTDVAEIRLSELGGPELAEQYGVTRSMINCIKRGKTWQVGSIWQGLV